nr:hydantoinase/oxoprolinase family protein [Actinomycetota bacterium]
NLFLGYLQDGAELGGEVVLKAQLSREALERVGRRLAMDALETALGVVQVADAEMVRALRVISIERGLDPREFALVAFGGAGPMHACALADELGVRTVLVPRASGVLSALGLAISDVRRDYVRPFLAALDEVESGDLEEGFAAMAAAAAEDLDEPDCEREADLRYRGQSFELTVDAADPEGLAERLHEAHERRYGYALEDEPVEVVNLRLTATVRRAKPELREGEANGDAESGRRRVNFDGDWTEAPVLDRARMGSGSEAEGPAIVELAESTCVVRPGWGGRVDGAGTLVLERS